MALDPTLSEACLKNSIKKFFVDNIFTAEGIDIDFDVQYVQPEEIGVEVDKWISIKFGNIEGGTLSRSHIIVYFFTRSDSEGVDLSILRDMILDKVTDLNATDGHTRIPLFDLTWNQIGGMIPTLSVESDEAGILKDGTNFKWMRINLAWGAK
ncbi:MAG: hypothetical protein DRP58_02785 [Spirochaetes bacterium]|nr:MAG: hypothetical protein DRP58_02785 [Spirochaetota bacterium]